MGIAIKKNSIDLGIVTTNGDAMLTFYRDTLGFKYERQIPMPIGEGIMHRMYCGESLIKLVVLPSAPAKAAPGGIGGATGYRYWTITISNLEEIVQACEKAGHKVAIAPREVRPGVRCAPSVRSGPTSSTPSLRRAATRKSPLAGSANGKRSIGPRSRKVPALTRPSIRACCSQRTVSAPATSGT